MSMCEVGSVLLHSISLNSRFITGAGFNLLTDLYSGRLGMGRCLCVSGDR